MSKVAIVYASAGGVTEIMAYKMKKLIEGSVTYDIMRTTPEKLEPFDFYILGTSTTGYGDILPDWPSSMSMFKDFDFTGKKAALFGLGNGYAFGDSFAGGLGQLYKLFKDRIEIVGSVSTEGYVYEESEAEIDGRFVGLVLDQVNEIHLTDRRIAKWIDELREYF